MTPQAPRLDLTPPIDLVDADPLTLRSRDERDGERLADADLSDVDLRDAAFVDCELAELIFTGTLLRGARFIDSVLSSPFAPELSAPRTIWRGTSIRTPRFGSAELFDGELNMVRLSGGKVDYLNLRGATLRDVVIENCTITELDLGGANCTRVALQDCRIGTLNLTRATCADVDLRSSDFERIDGVDGLRGCTIDEVQLALFSPVLAQHLGITVVDD